MDRQEKVELMEELIIDALGVDGALGEIVRALSTDQKEDIYPYIMRNNDIDFPEE